MWYVKEFGGAMLDEHEGGDDPQDAQQHW